MTPGRLKNDHRPKGNFREMVCKTCRSCHSDNISLAPDYGSLYYLCHQCGKIFIPEDDDDLFESEITAFVSGNQIEETCEEESEKESECPHCKDESSVILMYGMEECCSNCGLDPNIEEYESPEISHLWKMRTKECSENEMLISEVLVKTDPLRFNPDTPIGKFIRSKCGPHCPYAESCPQKLRNLYVCYKEDGEKNLLNMGKKRKKLFKKVKKEEEKTFAYVLTSTKGWFENYFKKRNYGSQNNYKEQSGN